MLGRSVANPKLKPLTEHLLTKMLRLGGQTIGRWARSFGALQLRSATLCSTRNSTAEFYGALAVAVAVRLKIIQDRFVSCDVPAQDTPNFSFGFRRHRLTRHDHRGIHGGNLLIFITRVNHAR